MNNGRWTEFSLRTVGAFALLATLLGAALSGCTKAALPPSAAKDVPAQSAAPVDDPPAALPVLPGCVEDGFKVDLVDVLISMPEDTLEAQREQLRDWLWKVTLGRLSMKSSVADVFSGVADEAVIREDALGQALRAPLGPTRIVTTKGGETLVLVEATSGDAWQAQVLEAIDEEATTLGRTPAHASVYGYELDAKRAYAHICKIQDLTAKQLEDSKLGYKTARVTRDSELDAFLASGADLLQAECKSDGLLLRGRIRPRTIAGHLRPEHVAAISQEVGRSFVAPKLFGASLAKLDPALRRELLSNASLVDMKVVRLPADVAAWRFANPGVSTVDLLFSQFLQELAGEGLGFSLDPDYSVAEARRAIAELLPALQDSASLKKLLLGWGVDERDLPAYGLDDTASLDEARSAFGELNDSLQNMTADDSVQPRLVDALDQASSESLMSYLVTANLMSRSGHQCARYVGPLAGTETAMTFYYTDLSAKLHFIDYQEMAPEGTIAGFESVVNHVGSAASCTAPRRPGTRLWFGFDTGAFARERDGSLRFGPVATRLFARGSATGGQHEEETEASATSRRFIEWWDQHYGSVANWDPEYEKLNQIMKWSVVSQHLRLTGGGKCLAFLSKTPLARDIRFGAWVKDHPALRSSRVLKNVEFTDQDSECMPLLNSKAYERCGNIGMLTGGVTAAKQAEVASKALRAIQLPPGLERFATKIAPTIEGDTMHLSSLSRSTGQRLENVEISARREALAFKATVDLNVGQVGTRVVINPNKPVATIETAVEQKAGKLKLRQSKNKLSQSELLAYDLDLAEVKLNVKPGLEDSAKAAAQQVVSKMGRSGKSLEDASTALASSHDLYIVDSDTIAVRLSREGDSAPAVAVMTSAGGARGPPNGTRLGFSVGAQDGGRFAYGGQNNAPALDVWLITGPETATYLSGSARRVPRDIAPVEDLRAAVAGGRSEVVRQVILKVANEDRERLGALRDQLWRMRYELAREDKSTDLVDDLMMKVAVEQSRTTFPTSGDGSLVSANRRIVAPATYPNEAAMPSPISKQGVALPPDKHWVARMMDAPIPALRSPNVADVNGTRLTLRKRAADEGRRQTDQVGSGIRLLGGFRPVTLVAPCDDRNSNLPRCTLPASAEQQLISQMLLRFACSQSLGDPSSVDPTCKRQAEACDTDGDGVYSIEESRCLRDVRARYQSTTPQ